ncbi:hypothetical protein [Actinophytocola gossypii]|uniref:Uncharacterized protein n=1 Tax=Actinophytocola gossypii TaxID=2812003 RepID=A0ABT2JIN1_9PSEU|nr:hypothetical protein [Actinophytocola gossypii]MCT2587094.1 hypothetical protein [Actinophytocola gossypii]
MNTKEYKYVLLMVGRNPFLNTTVTTEDVKGTETELTTALRPWLLAYLRNGFHDNGWYSACLVAPDEHGSYDTYHSLAMEDIIWYWDEECAPLSQLAK